MRRPHGPRTVMLGLLAMFVATRSVCADTRIVFADADAWVDTRNTDDPHANHGAESILTIGDVDRSAGAVVLVRFDVLDGIPPGTTIESATFRLFASEVAHPTGHTFVARLIADAWDELTVSAATMPSSNGNGVTIGSSPNPVFEATDFVDGWVNGGIPNHGISIRRVGTGSGGTFGSREGPEALVPVLEVVLGKLIGCSADLDRSGAVDFDDLLELLTEWGECGRCAADVDHTGAVDVDDLLLLLGAWGPCPQAP